jgi:FdhD protein
MARAVSRNVRRTAHRANGADAGEVRAVPEEVPVAFSYGGTTHAVMMATPADLEDFAYGFTLTDGIVGNAGAIEHVDVVEHGAGIDLQIMLSNDASGALAKRRRHKAGPVGCGLCGIESIEEAVQPPPQLLTRGVALSPAQIAEAARLLKDFQPLNAETHAVHAAGFYVPSEGIVLAREDVGRHNALDKLIGAMARAGIESARGAIVITSRVSVEMVQKTAISGCPVLLAVSAPTALAIRTADEAGLTLVAIVRGEDFEIFTRPDRLSLGESTDVAGQTHLHGQSDRDFLSVPTK